MRFPSVTVMALLHAASVSGQRCGLFDQADRMDEIEPDNFDDLTVNGKMIACTNEKKDNDYPVCREEFIEDCQTVDCNGFSACVDTKIDGAFQILCRDNINNRGGSCVRANMANIQKGGSVECVGDNGVCAQSRMSGDVTKDIDFNVNCDGRFACSSSVIEAGMGAVVCKNGGSKTVEKACGILFSPVPTTITARCLICDGNGCGDGDVCKFTPVSETGEVGLVQEDCPPNGSFKGECVANDFCDLDEVCLIFLDSLQVENANLRSMLILLEANVNVLNDTSVSLKLDFDNLNGTVNDIESLLNSVNDTNTLLKSQVDELEDNVNSLNGADAELQSQVDDLNGTVNILESELNTVNDTTVELKSRVNDLEGEVSALNETNSEQQAEIASLNGTVTDLKRELDALNETNAELKSQVDELNATNADQQLEMDQLESDLSTLNETNVNLQLEVELLKQVVSAMNGTLAQLVEKLHNSKSLKSTRRRGN